MYITYPFASSLKIKYAMARKKIPNSFYKPKAQLNKESNLNVYVYGSLLLAAILSWCREVVFIIYTDIVRSYNCNMARAHLKHFF